MTELSASMRDMNKIAAEKNGWLDRFRGEMHFVEKYLEVHHDKDWAKLAEDAVAHVAAGISAGRGAQIVVTEAETMLAPLAAEAKKFTVHCVGHAHIDMLWMWDWPETTACTNDTFSTVCRLMDEYPDFHFSQSQTSVYDIMVKYFPELKKKVQKRIDEGKWEVVSSQWVEGDKNLASGEILCRHMLYTRNYLKKEYGLPYDAVKIDWEPDTFGHGCTHPGILNAGGVSRYYFCRGGKGHRIFWWIGKDGGKVLAWDDSVLWYNGNMDQDIVTEVMKFNKETKLKDYLFVYGVGDHGGGPTRKDLDKAVTMAQWPIYPVIKFSTTDAFFTAVESADLSALPVVEGEMNYVFEGCYTSQTNIKFANRKMECFLPEAEFVAVIGMKKLDFEYPLADINAGWQRAMFCQFHDILPGSGVRGSYQYAQGLLQETMATTTAIKTRVMRELGGMVNTEKLFAGTEAPERSLGPGVGAGPGDMPAAGAVTRYSSGGVRDTFLIMNPNPWERTEMAEVRIWDKDWSDDEYLICAPDGNKVQAQIVGKDNGTWGYWGHRYTTVAIPIKVPAGGYAVYGVTRGKDAKAVTGTCSGDGKGIIENEFFRVQVEKESGAIIHLIDKKSGKDYVPAGGRMGVLEFMKEAPHGMTAWTIGEIVESRQLVTGGTLECPNNGPFIAKTISKHKFGNNSESTLTITVAAGVPRVDFALDLNWLELGNSQQGVPMLKVSFETGIADGIAKFECANGSVTRPCGALISNGQQADANAPAPAHTDDVPAQKWADLSAADGTGITLLNDCKYGHSIAGGDMKITLVHSSYDPDPIPEMGKHIINFAIAPHDASWTDSNATRAGYDINLPVSITGVQEGDGNLSLINSYVEIATPNIMLSGLKKAENSDELVIRLYEMEGKATTARVVLDHAFNLKSAKQADLMEQPLAKNSAKINDNTLSVDIPAYGMVTVLMQ